MFFSQEVSALSCFVDGADCDAVTFSQGHAVHCQSSVQERLERLIGQGGVRDADNPSDLQEGPSA